MNSVLIIDKPSGLTSHDVVNRARRILRERSIGHLGTLDPMATGVLPLVTGNLTRLAQFYTSSEKTYEGTIRFGFATTTYDAEGDPTTTPARSHSASRRSRSPGRPLPRHHRANPTALLRQKNQRRPSLQTGTPAKRSCAEIRSG